MTTLDLKCLFGSNFWFNGWLFFCQCKRSYGVFMTSTVVPRWCYLSLMRCARACCSSWRARRACRWTGSRSCTAPTGRSCSPSRSGARPKTIRALTPGKYGPARGVPTAPGPLGNYGPSRLIMRRRLPSSIKFFFRKQRLHQLVRSRGRLLVFL